MESKTNNNARIVKNNENANEYLIKGVKEHKNLKFEVKGFNYKVYSTQDPDTLSLVLEKIKGNENRSISVLYNNAHVSGSPVTVTKVLPKYEQNSSDNTIVFFGVKNPKKLSLKSIRDLTYELYADENSKTTFHLKYTNPGEVKNKLTLKYGDRVLNENAIEIGSVEPLQPGKLLYAGSGLGDKVQMKATILESEIFEYLGNDDATVTAGETVTAESASEVDATVAKERIICEHCKANEAKNTEGASVTKTTEGASEEVATVAAGETVTAEGASEVDATVAAGETVTAESASEVNATVAEEKIICENCKANEAKNTEGACVTKTTEGASEVDATVAEEKIICENCKPLIDNSVEEIKQAPLKCSRCSGDCC